jgi:mevalonate kinase
VGGGGDWHFLFFVIASAPGKVILFGEHAVVYGRPALAVPVKQIGAEVEVKETSRKGIWITATQIGLHAELSALADDHPIKAAIRDVFQCAGRSLSASLDIHISSTIPPASGLGSGAAVSVALVRALAGQISYPISDAQVNDLVFEVEKLYHGTPSGIDNTVITYAAPVFFTRGKPIATFKAGRPFSLVIGDTGIRAPTRESVGEVRAIRERERSRIDKIFDGIGEIALQARRVIEGGQPDKLGELMNRNHVLLQDLTVSSPELDRLVDATRRAGASGAKLSGGGRGGNMIALVEEKNSQTVATALMAAGARSTIITTVS